MVTSLHPDNNDKIIKVLLVLLVLALIWLCCSCGCNYHLNKAKKKCGTVTEVITFHDTVITKELKTDTLFKHLVKRDTIVLSKDKLLIKYFYNTHDSTVYIQGKCVSDTIIKVINIPTTTINADWFDKFKWFIYIAGGLVFAYFVIKLFKN